MSRNQGWFWTPDRLRLLCRILDRAARRDVEGLYLDVSLRPYVADEGKKVGLHVDMGNAGSGLNILVFLGVLERVGRKRAGYRRRYFPSAIAGITEADLQRYREAHGVKSSWPPR